MFVAASTRCYTEMNIKDALGKLADLEFTASEIAIGKKSQISFFSDSEESIDNVAQLVRASRRIAPTSLFLDMEPDDPEFMERFLFTVQIAKATKIVQITIKSSPLGTPYNAEVERLRDLARLAVHEGLILGLETERGRMSEDPDSLKSFCNSVQDLTITLDPSHFIYGYAKPKDYEPILGFTSHIRVRDTTKDKFQIQVGQGIQDYSRFVIQLEKVNYRGALCVDISRDPELDHDAEMRKMRLLLESLL